MTAGKTAGAGGSVPSPTAYPSWAYARARARKREVGIHIAALQAVILEGKKKLHLAWQKKARWWADYQSSKAKRHARANKKRVRVPKPKLPPQKVVVAKKEAPKTVVPVVQSPKAGGSKAPPVTTKGKKKVGQPKVPPPKAPVVEKPEAVKKKRPPQTLPCPCGRTRTEKVIWVGRVKACSRCGHAQSDHSIDRNVVLCNRVSGADT